MISSIIIDSKSFLSAAAFVLRRSLCKSEGVQSQQRREDSLSVHFSLESEEIKSIGRFFVKLVSTGISGMFNLYR